MKKTVWWRWREPIVSVYYILSRSQASGRLKFGHEIPVSKCAIESEVLEKPRENCKIISIFRIFYLVEPLQRIPGKNLIGMLLPLLKGCTDGEKETTHWD